LQKIKGLRNRMRDVASYEPELLDDGVMAEVQAFHESFLEYSTSSLSSLTSLAGYLGVGQLLVKDESSRFNLNSFKVLGASFAVGKALAEKLGEPISRLPFPLLKERVRKELPHVTLAATTDGNHGRGVAWMGRQLGIPVVVYMPRGTTETRLNHIRKLGARAAILDLNYDDTVRWVAEKAREEDWLLIQDTAWEGYENVPRWIMQGYSTIARELAADLGGRIPTHVFIQAGVGAFAGVMAEAFHIMYGAECPRIIVVEANAADCFYESALGGRDVVKTGDLSTIMAGLACGEQNPLGNRILKKLAYAFISAPDWAAGNGMRILATPLPGDDTIVSGESGAVGMGVVERIMGSPEYSGLKEMLGLDGTSRILTFSTEGDTDPGVYRNIVWFGGFREPVGA